MDATPDMASHHNGIDCVWCDDDDCNRCIWVIYYAAAWRAFSGEPA